MGRMRKPPAARENVTLDFVYYRDIYDQKYPWYNKTLNEVGLDIQKQGYLTLNQLLIINKWKGLRLTKPLILENKPEEVIEKTRHAFSFKDDRNRIEALTPHKIRGVGVSVASTILTFWNPKSYGVIDRHTSRCLYRNAYDLKKSFGIKSLFCEVTVGFRGQFSVSDYLEYLKVIRTLAEKTSIQNGTEFIPRHVDMALFMEDKENGGTLSVWKRRGNP